MVRVKICGITNLEDALCVFFNKADALGFVFYKKSPRYISPQKAANISRILPKGILRAGVFVDASAKSVRKIAKSCRLDMLQFHGDETAGYCKGFKGYKVIKAFKVNGKLNLSDILKYKTFGYLFDTFSKSCPGGTGKKFNWNLLKNVDKMNRQVFLSGGLNVNNVKQAITKVHPDWCDVSSALEYRPGEKNHKKIKLFINKCHKRK